MFFQNFIHFSKQVFIEKDWKHVKMLEIEKEFNITSTWFFFSRITENKKLFNPNYELKNNMVVDLMQKIKNNNSEIKFAREKKIPIYSRAVSYTHLTLPTMRTV